jgi:CheY-like chemotaxis protein
MPRVLLIEDNELNRDMLSRRLRRKGYEDVVAEDGASGVSQARASRPDLVIMDLGLPVMDGWEATRLLKGAPETATVPIIALTAHAMPSERRRAMEAGCDDYDTKPVELDRLLGKIEALLGAE